MLILKAYQFKLEPTADQEERLRVLCGHARFVWNHALAECERMMAAGEGIPKYSGYGGLASWITWWKAQPETAFLREAYTDNLQQKLKDLETAWKRYFDKSLDAERPRFKKKGRDVDSIRFVNFPKYCSIDNRRVKLPSNLGWVKFRKSKNIVGSIKNCTVRFESNQWYISFQVEQEIPEPQHPSRSIIGIDMGVAKFVTQSNGKVYEPLSAFKKSQEKLAKEQRKLSRKIKFSSNWRKQKAKINRLHRKIADCRKDYLHKTSTKISKNHTMIIIEDLKVRNMSKSAKGDSGAPGTSVKAKSGLNKSILDQGWYEFRRQLEYKQLWKGGEVLAVPAHYTSQRCPCCDHVSKDNRKTQAGFKCVVCGFKENADVVGAINILAAGQALLASVPEQSGAVTACGETGLPDSMKQEPVRNREEVAPQTATAV